MSKSHEYIWSTQKEAPGCEIINCPEYDPYADFKRDPTGYYVLIKVNFATCRIEVAICNKEHLIEMIFTGRKAQDLYDEIFKYEKKNTKEWFKEKTHIAYLGKELKKAELALVLGNNAYFQE